MSCDQTESQNSGQSTYLTPQCGMIRKVALPGAQRARTQCILKKMAQAQLFFHLAAATIQYPVDGRVGRCAVYLRLQVIQPAVIKTADSIAMAGKV